MYSFANITFDLAFNSVVVSCAEPVQVELADYQYRNVTQQLASLPSSLAFSC